MNNNTCWGYRGANDIVIIRMAPAYLLKCQLTILLKNEYWHELTSLARSLYDCRQTQHQ